MIEAITIHNRFKKNKIAYSQIKDQIIISYPQWTRAEELDSLASFFFNYESTIDSSEISETIVWKAIEKIRESELTHFIENNDIFNLNFSNDLKIKNPQMSSFIKKLCLDQISFKILGRVNSQINQLFSLVKFDQKHNMGMPLPEGQVIFAYINMNKMDTPKTPRFGSVFDSYEVSNHKVIGIFHKNIKLQVSINIGTKYIVVDTEIWCGNIVCEE